MVAATVGRRVLNQDFPKKSLSTDQASSSMTDVASRFYKVFSGDAIQSLFGLSRGFYQLAAKQASGVSGDNPMDKRGGPVTVGKNESIANLQITSPGNGGDAVRIQYADGAKLKNINVIDTHQYGGRGGHVDAGQMIPGDAMIGGILRDVTINGFNVKGNANADSVQGLFSSDGCLVDIDLRHGMMKMGSPNKLAFNGFASGVLDGFVDGEGQPVVARLQPLRIGGNPGTGNVWVLSVSPEDHECNAGKIIGSNYSPTHDHRKVMPNPESSGSKSDVGLCNFRLDEFKAAVKEKTVKELLGNPTINAEVDNWLEWVKTTNQPEYKGRYEEINKKIEKAKKSGAKIDKLLGNQIASVFYQQVAKTYGSPCRAAE